MRFSASSRASSAVFHKRAAAGLNVEDDHIRACGKLFAHDGAYDKRYARLGARNVAQSVHFLVGRVEVGGLAGNGDTEAVYVFSMNFSSEIPVLKPGKLQLVYRTARMPKAAAGHFRDLTP